jgi:hypothetical protein
MASFTKQIPDDLVLDLTTLFLMSFVLGTLVQAMVK